MPCLACLGLIAQATARLSRSLSRSEVMSLAESLFKAGLFQDAAALYGRLGAQGGGGLDAWMSAGCSLGRGGCLPASAAAAWSSSALWTPMRCAAGDEQRRLVCEGHIALRGAEAERDAVEATVAYVRAAGLFLRGGETWKDHEKRS